LLLFQVVVSTLMLWKVDNVRLFILQKISKKL
jgi:hypothetical protein